MSFIVQPKAEGTVQSYDPAGLLRKLAPDEIAVIETANKRGRKKWRPAMLSIYTPGAEQQVIDDHERILQLGEYTRRQRVLRISIYKRVQP